jgi:hypothetical protein
VQLKRPLRRFFCVLFPVNHAAASVPCSWSIVQLAVILKPTRIFSQIRQPLGTVHGSRSASRWPLLELDRFRLEIRRQLVHGARFQILDPPPAGHDPARQIRRQLAMFFA